MIKISSGLPRKSSGIFGNLRKFWEIFGNVRLAFGTNLGNFGNLREVVGNLRKIVKNAVIRTRTLHVSFYANLQCYLQC